MSYTEHYAKPQLVNIISAFVVNVWCMNCSLNAVFAAEVRAKTKKQAMAELKRRGWYITQLKVLCSDCRKVRRKTK